jgi:poly(A) polymerase
MRESTLQRFIRQEGFDELLAFHKADALALDGNLAFYEYCSVRLETLKKSAQTETPKLIDGKDLIHLGFSPGPEFSEILREVEDLALEKQLSTKEEALEYVIKTFVR